ncbi:hypothetical protein Poly30_39840 [Planctomycetes bacterium Poly30]|uniref:Uncharacterized protein n=1 Tax=Saltatorellus ferox TaxID=2528018 RepID=A0A518EWL4_9BACT|nr:hypothetical protein Poly30_39840 [Planctomycetes bacterium Poly30]
MLLEIMITLSIFAGLLTMFALSLDTAEDDRGFQEHLDLVREDAQKVLLEVREVLSQTQVVSGFPIVFPGNTIGAAFPALVHGPANVNPPTPQCQELAFLTPSDADGDGWPDTNAGGSIAWSGNPAAVTCVGNADGTNRVRLVAANGAARVLSRRIRSIVIDDSASTGFTIPLSALRITVYYDRDPERPNLPAESLQTTLLLSRDDLLP